jgi:hypothetical protein
MLRLACFILLISLCGCTNSPESASPKVGPILWDESGQVTISIPTGDVVAVIGEPIFIAPAVKSGTPSSFSVTPTLPVGMSVNKTSGIISGIASAQLTRTRYNLNVVDNVGRSNSTAFFIEVRPDISLINPNIVEVATVSGAAVNLKDLISGGKGSYKFEIVDTAFGTIVGSVLTPGTTAGNVEIRVVDNNGQGSLLKFQVRIGVPQISVSYTNPAEGQPIVLQLALSGASSLPATINYSVQLFAAMDSNVSQDPGSVTFAPGQVQKTIVIPTYNNGINKNNGLVNVHLNVDDGARFVDGAQSTRDVPVTIFNVNPPPVVAFNPGSSTVVEYDQTASLTIKLDRASAKTVSVNYGLDQIFSTVQANDHNFVDGLATFLPGETFKTISFHLYHDVNGNQPANADRLMSFKLSNPINGTITVGGRHNMAVTDPMVIDISSVQTDFVLLSELQTRAWNGIQSVLVRVEPTGVVMSSSVTRAAFSSGFISRASETKITVENYGSIIGRGGASGVAADPAAQTYHGYCNQQIPGFNGGDGGPAISVVVPMTIINRGLIASGGGGGGSGVSAVIGQDNICSNRENVTGGRGGSGAGALGAQPVRGEEGGGPTTSQNGQAYVSSGGAGGGPGEVGVNGQSPVLYFNDPLSVGVGGQPTFAIIDNDGNNGHYISLQNFGIIKGK